MQHLPDATTLLARAQCGDAQAADELFVLLQRELRALAGELMRAERAEHTLQPTALVNEAWLKLFARGPSIGGEDRAHFMRTVARAMRHVLVDHARARRRSKRDAGRTEALDLTLAGAESVDSFEVVALDEALHRLAEFDAQGAKVVELRFFCGFSNAEVAAALSVSEATVERAWRSSRLWLARELSGAQDAER